MSFCVRTLAGDIDRNATVATTDASIIKPHFGQTPDATTFVYDFDANGVIATTDYSLVKPLFGHTAASCP